MNLTYSNLVPKADEDGRRQCLGEDVSQHVLTRTVVERKMPRSQVLTDEEVLDVHVLGVEGELGVSSERNSTLIVALERENPFASVGIVGSHFANNLAVPNCLL